MFIRKQVSKVLIAITGRTLALKATKTEDAFFRSIEQR